MSTFRATLSIQAFMAALALLFSGLVSGDDKLTRIFIRAEGQALGQPDVALVNVGVQTQKKQANEALADNAKKMSRAIEFLKKEGLSVADIQTQAFNLSAQYSYDSSGQQKQPELIGYNVSNGLTIRIKDTKKLGAVIDQLVNLGVNQINSIRFDFINSDALLEKARQQAVDNLQTKAKFYAKAFNLPKMKLVKLNESPQSFHEPEMLAVASMKMASMADVATSVESGQLAVKFVLDGEYVYSE
jgi:uncharacterized protein YggE